MNTKRIGIAASTVLSVFLSACAAAKAPEAPDTEPRPDPPPNLLGSTDELQLVTELALDMAKTYGGDRVLVVFDIDNTLLAMEQDLGSDQWYYWQKSLEESDPCNSMRVDDLLTTQGALYFASAMRPVQDNTAELVRRMQDAGLKMIALTSRGPEYRLATFRELRRNDLSFWPSAWSPARGYGGPFVPEGGQREALYEDGVFMTAGQHKGVMLRALLDRSGQPYPELIIAIDDKQEHLNDLMSSFVWNGTPIQAWRYTREDVNVSELDHGETADQWAALRPALVQLEDIVGPDHYDLPEPVQREGCSSE